jgi:glycine cleavage system aminomethyltransferase T
VKLDKGDFIGRAAMERAKAAGISRALCCLTIDEPSAVALGGEPILLGGEPLGRVTSGGYGYTVRKSIAYGYLPAEHSKPGTRAEVELFGTRYAATVEKEPLYDPKGERVRG